MHHLKPRTHTVCGQQGHGPWQDSPAEACCIQQHSDAAPAFVHKSVHICTTHKHILLKPQFYGTTLEIYSLPLALLRGFPWIAPTPS